MTRLINFLGLRTPPEEDLVQATDKNPKGYWESESLVAFNTGVLTAVGCDMRCPVALEPGWENDARLEALRQQAREVVDRIFPAAPWVWKDPRLCLAFAFWRSVLPVRPVVVLVNRNPLEIAASTLRVRTELGKIYTLALWERYLRQALGQIAGVPVLVTNYGDLLSAPLAWCDRTQAFLASAGVPVHAPRESDVMTFVDAHLRHAEFTHDDLAHDPDVSGAQRSLFVALEELEGGHNDLSAPVLPDETPTTEALLEERRRALEAKHDLVWLLETEHRSRWWWRIRNSRYLVPARPVYAIARRVVKTLSALGGARSAHMDER